MLKKMSIIVSILIVGQWLSYHVNEERNTLKGYLKV